METNTQKTKLTNSQILQELSQLTQENCNQCCLDYINVDQQDDIVYLIDSDTLFEELENNGFFNEEVIYYHKAIKYLQENDASLTDSIEIAHEHGYTLENINSELLATLLLNERKRNNFFEYVAPQLNKLTN
tara:strand:+ start:463 stop:858 length:396 start_codon:yes stop_codon:yes gene_type:complete